MPEQTNKNLDNLIKEIKDQNVKNFLLQAITAKSTAEIAGPDDDDQRKIFKSIDDSLKQIKEGLAEGVSDAFGKRIKTDVDKEQTIETKPNKQVRNTKTLVGDIGNFFEGIKSGFKDTAGYLLGQKEDPVQDKPTLAVTPEAKKAKPEGTVTSMLKQVESTNKLLEKQTDVIKAGLDNLSNKIQSFVDSKKVGSLSQAASISKPRIKLKSSPTATPASTPNARSVGGMMVGPISKIDTVKTALAPLSGGTIDVDAKYTVEGRLEAQQELEFKQRQIEASQSSGGVVGGLLDGLPGGDRGRRAPRPVPGSGGRVARGLGAVRAYALPVAAAAATAATVDYGLGKAGVGKDAQGNTLQVDEAQDEANWQKMSLGEKVQSGFARGIEKVGSVAFMGNLSAEAKSSRVKKETEFLKSRFKEGENEFQGEQITSHPNYQKYVQEAYAGGMDEISAQQKASMKVKADLIREGSTPTPQILSKDVTSMQAVPYNTGAIMQRESTINREFETGQSMPVASAPIISNSVNNNQTQTFIPMKPQPRSIGSSFERFQDRVTMG